MKKPEIITIAVLAAVLVLSLAVLLRPEPSKEPAIGQPAAEVINGDPGAKTEADTELDLNAEAEKNGQ